MSPTICRVEIGNSTDKNLAAFNFFIINTHMQGNRTFLCPFDIYFVLMTIFARSSTTDSWLYHNFPELIYYNYQYLECLLMGI